ncbi:MAG: hypothetical protein RL662_1646 [Bacteroidota bacterium]|jgi:predicted HTH transcriptional regulator
MDDIEIHQQLAKGETDTQDFKLEITSSQKIAKTLVAFANTKGGRIWIGVKDNGRILGCEILEEQYMIEQAIDKYSKPAVYVQFVNHVIDDKEILEVQIPQSPHSAQDDQGQWMVYVRNTDHTLLAGVVTVETLKNRNKSVLIKYSELEKNLLILIHEEPNLFLNQVVAKLKKPRRILILILPIYDRTHTIYSVCPQ